MQKERFRYFIKVPELAMFYSEITDYRSADVYKRQTLQSAGHDFTARGSIMVETGWRAVLNEPVEEKEEDMTLLPDIVQGLSLIHI